MMAVVRWRGAVVVAEEVASVAGRGGDGSEGGGEMVFVVMAAVAVPLLQSCTHWLLQQDSALTWWNSHKRTIGVEAAYAMNWRRNKP
ncbi:hypothetical protein Tco_1478268 [Tanacetum coccineum]